MGARSAHAKYDAGKERDVDHPGADSKRHTSTTPNHTTPSRLAEQEDGLQESLFSNIHTRSCPTRFALIPQESKNKDLGVPEVFVKSIDP